MKIKKNLLLLTTLITSTLHTTTIEQELKKARNAQENNHLEYATLLLYNTLKKYPDTQHAPDIYYDLGMLLNKQEKYQQAIPYLKKAVFLNSKNINKLFSLGTTLGSLGEFDTALTIFEQTLKNRPDIDSARYNYAYMLKAAGKLDRAIEVYREILDKDPEHTQAHLGLAFSYMINGNLENGWREHIWNLKKQNKDSAVLHTLLQKDQLAGKTIMLSYEGGLGDTLNFIRYVQTFKQSGANTIVCAQKPLIPLLSRCPYIDQLITKHDPIPPCHARTTLMSLPAICGSNGIAIPTSIPYIFADPLLINYWKHQLKPDTNFKIGICWQADVFNDSSRTPIARRGIPLHLLATLSTIPGVSLYSLQKKDGVDQIEQLPADLTIHTFENLDEHNGPFIDTAAIIENLDLIISIDSATAHLAGALGRPVLLLLPYVIDWRWIYGKADSPWYPTMHIFKQPKAFDWESVAQQVHEHVRELVQKSY